MKTIILICICMTSCIGTSVISQTSGLSTSELASIPKGSKEVIIKGERDVLYDKIVEVLIQRGHRIVKEDKERFYILTEGKDVGQSTIHRMTIVISSGEANIKSEWMPGQDAVIGANAWSGLSIVPSWSVADFTTGRPAIAFAEAVSIGKEVGGEILFK